MLTEGGNTGQGLISKVFRERAGAVMDALARSAGTKSSSASRLLAFAFPILGKQIVSNGLNPGGLAQKLFDQKKGDSGRSEHAAGIETAGNREEAPVADNDTEEGRSRNRRVDVVLINR